MSFFPATTSINGKCIVQSFPDWNVFKITIQMKTIWKTESSIHIACKYYRRHIRLSHSLLILTFQFNCCSNRAPCSLWFYFAIEFHFSYQILGPIEYVLTEMRVFTWISNIEYLCGAGGASWHCYSTNERYQKQNRNINEKHGER